MRIIPILALPFLCMACASQPWEPSAVRIVTLQMPYTQAYHGLEAGMRRCQAPKHQRIDSQIFPAERYAQVISYKTKGATETVALMARLSPQGRATRMKMNVVTRPDRAQSAAWMVYWAQGGQSCPPDPPAASGGVTRPAPKV